MSLTDRFVSWRNGLISDPRFQSWAARNLLTRGIARRKAAESFGLVTGFVHSQVLLAAVETRLLQAADAAPLTPETFAPEAGLPVAGAERLIKAAASLRLLHLRADGRYILGEQGAALLGNPSVFAMIRHHAAFYRDLADPVALLKARTDQTALARFWAYTSAGENPDAAAYSDLMAETQAMIAAEVLGAFDLARHKRLMDVGGGVGAFLSRAGAAHPRLQMTLVDLAPVIALARDQRASDPALERFTFAPCDFLTEALPTGADLISFIRVLHDHDDAPVLQMLQSARRAIASGGRLLLAEPMSATPGAEAMGEAYFGFYLWAMGRGRPRRPDELSALLLQAGFSRVRLLPTHQPLLVRVIVAE